MSEKTEAFVARLSCDAIAAGQRGDRTYFDIYTGCRDVPSAGHRDVLVIPLEGEAPPAWPVGTKVRWVANPKVVSTVASTLFMYQGKWRFIATTGEMLHCTAYEPIPPTASLTLRVTGTPEEVEALRVDAEHSRTWLRLNDVTVEVLGNDD